MHNTKCNILIVGFGPTGSVLANLLSKYNITIHILEKENEIYNLPRAVHFDDEIMRTFKSIGIFKKFIKKTIINKGTKFVDEYNNVFGEDIVPYMRSWNSPIGFKTKSFYETSAITKAFATSDICEII